MAHRDHFEVPRRYPGLLLSSFTTANPPTPLSAHLPCLASSSSSSSFTASSISQTAATASVPASSSRPLKTRALRIRLPARSCLPHPSHLTDGPSTPCQTRVLATNCNAPQARGLIAELSATERPYISIPWHIRSLRLRLPRLDPRPQHLSAIPLFTLIQAR